jgi:hypothetical protein
MKKRAVDNEEEEGDKGDNILDIISWVGRRMGKALTCSISPKNLEGTSLVGRR